MSDNLTTAPPRISFDPFGPAQSGRHPYDQPAAPLWCWDEFGIVVVAQRDLVGEVLEHPDVYRAADPVPRISQATAVAHVALPDTLIQGERHLTSSAQARDRIGPLLDSAFSADRVARRIDRVSRRAHDHLTRLAPTGGADLHLHYVRPMIAATVNDFIGIPPADADAVDTACQATRDLLDPNQGIRDQISAIDLLTSHPSYVDDLIARRANEPRDDLLTDLAHAQRAGVITRADLHYLLLISRPAIEDTTVRLVLAAIDVMLKTGFWAGPQNRFQRRTYIDRALAETRRALTPSQGLQRYTTTSTQLGDYTLPPGTPVIALTADARDCAPSPLTLNTATAPGARAAIDNLMRIPDIRLVDPRPHTIVPSPFAHGIAPLPVTWTPRELPDHSA